MALPITLTPKTWLHNTLVSFTDLNNDVRDPLTAIIAELNALGSKVSENNSAFSNKGVLTVTVGTLRIYNITGRTLTISTTHASVDTVPTGASIIVTIKKGGTSIWATNPANRPTILAGTNRAYGGVPDTTTWANGEYLTVDIAQVGSTVAGADLTVQVIAK